MPKDYTLLGFEVYDHFKDTKGHDVRVQRSSSEKEDAVWIFCKRGEEYDSPHLNIEQAKLMINALQEFIDDYED